MKKLIMASVAAMSLAAVAETTPVMVSLVTPAQAPSSDFDVEGFRLSLIYGQCGKFTGLDIGVANVALDDFTGVGIGGVNVTFGSMNGAQIGVVNWQDDLADSWDARSKGAQVGILNCAASFCGVQVGALNVSSRAIYGVQDAYVNFARDVRGLQAAYLNVATGGFKGLQFGLINYVGTMESGLQVGIVNVISGNGWFPVLPIVNGGF